MRASLILFLLLVAIPAAAVEGDPGERLPAECRQPLVLGLDGGAFVRGADASDDLPPEFIWRTPERWKCITLRLFDAESFELDNESLRKEIESLKRQLEFRVEEIRLREERLSTRAERIELLRSDLERVDRKYRKAVRRGQKKLWIGIGIGAGVTALLVAQ